MKMVFSTKMKETGKPNNIYQSSQSSNLVVEKRSFSDQNSPSKPAVFYKINMFENLKSSAECSDCKKTKPNLIK